MLPQRKQNQNPNLKTTWSLHSAQCLDRALSLQAMYIDHVGCIAYAAPMPMSCPILSCTSHPWPTDSWIQEDVPVVDEDGNAICGNHAGGGGLCKCAFNVNSNNDDQVCTHACNAFLPTRLEMFIVSQACRHHPSAPVFHDGKKGYSCCNVRIIHDHDACTVILHLFTSSCSHLLPRCNVRAEWFCAHRPMCTTSTISCEFLHVLLVHTSQQLRRSRKHRDTSRSHTLQHIWMVGQG